MASQYPKRVNGKTYWYLREMARVEGKPKMVSERYLGSAADIAVAVAGGDIAMKPERTRHLAFGDVAAVWDVMTRLDVVGIVDAVTGGTVAGAGASAGTYLALAALNRVVAPCSTLAFATWWQTTAADRFTRIGASVLDHRRFWDAMHAVSLAELAEIQRRVTAVTVVFDAGQNSTAKFAYLASAGLRYVGSVPPSDHPNLLALPASRRRPVDAERFPGVTALTTRREIYGADRRVVLTHSPTLHDKQARGFDQTLAQAGPSPRSWPATAPNPTPNSDSANSKTPTWCRSPRCTTRPTTTSACTSSPACWPCKSPTSCDATPTSTACTCQSANCSTTSPASQSGHTLPDTKSTPPPAETQKSIKKSRKLGLEQGDKMIMSATGNIGNFTTVDGAPDASWFIDFMDIANALPEYRSMKDDLAATLGDLDGKTVLEVGCGTGDDAREVAALVGSTGQVVAIDLSETMLTEARRRSVGSSLPVEFRTADLSGLDFPDNSFDGARAKLVLMHCADIETGLDELVRVIRPGGRIAVFDYDFDTTIVDHPDAAATREMMRCFSDGHHNNWSGRQLFRRMQVRNLREVTVSPHTVVIPFEFFRTFAAGRLRAAQQTGQLALTGGQLSDWWQPLLRAQEQGQFFASFTGFVVGATKP